jgi:hypothetical protein
MMEMVLMFPFFVLQFSCPTTGAYTRHLQEGKNKCQSPNITELRSEMVAGSNHHATTSGGIRMSMEEASVHAVNWAFVLVDTGMAMTVLRTKSVKT